MSTETAAPSPAVLLDTRVGDLQGHVLELHCCGGVVYYYPLRLLAENRGADMLLRAAVARLRCKRCGDGPESVALLEINLTDGKGRRLGWRVELSA